MRSLATSGADVVAPDVPQVVYIGGADRSGSTLLALLLGEAPGVCAVGELRNLWQRGVQRDERCTCGEPFSACPFWSDVGTRAFGGWDAVDVEWVAAFQRSIERLALVPRWALAPPRRRTVDLRRYVAIYTGLYSAIAAASDAEIVVDASKDLSHAAILVREPSVDLRVVHLVRDSRGVAYSWTRPHKRPEATGPASPAEMVTVGPLRSALRWAVWNTCWRAIARPSAPSASLRYENFIGDPTTQLRDVAAKLGLTLLAGAADTIAADSSFQRSVQHHVSGNPMRFNSGRVRLRLDDEWRVSMPFRDRALVSALTWPLLLAYHYQLPRHARAQRG